MVDIVIVEDNIELADLVSKFLEKEGYSIFHAKSGEEALAFFKENTGKLILLDITLPGIDGFEVCSKIREKNNTPIIILSAKVDKEDKMDGFGLGADDYIEKPVDIDLLIVKIAALMRRNYELKSKNRIITSGEITIDKESMKVELNEQILSLTMKEYELLVLLIENPGKALNKDYLFNKVWGSDSFSENQTLTVHIKMLRDKVEENPKKPKRIQTVWGVGYKYEEI